MECRELESLLCGTQPCLFFSFSLLFSSDVNFSSSLQFDAEYKSVLRLSGWVQYAYQTIKGEFKTENSWETKSRQLQRHRSGGLAFLLSFSCCQAEAQRQDSKDRLKKTTVIIIIMYL